MAAAAAIVVLLLWLAVAGAQGPAPCDTASVHQGASGTWTVYTALTFDTGPTHIVSLATDPAGNEPWYATNGQEIAASADHGCGWRIVYKLPATPSADMPLSSGTSAIKSVSTGGGTVLAAVSGPARVVDLGDTNIKGQKPSANGATVVLRSTDSGASFTATQTLPNTSGDTGPIVQAPSSPNTVYLATGLAMRQSTDGGKTFSDPDVLVEGNADTTALGGVAEIAVDPGDADNVLARGPWQVHHATNGRNYTPYPGNTENHPYGLTLHGPAFGGGSGSRGRALFVQGDEPNKKDQVDRYLVSEDGAQNFATHLPGEWGALSGAPTALAAPRGHGPRDDVVITTSGGTYRWSPKLGKFVWVDEFNLGPFEDAQAVRDTFVFFRGTAITTYAPPAGGLGEVPTPDPEPPSDPASAGGTRASTDPPVPDDVLKGAEGTLAPASGDIHVPIGASVPVDYSLSMPARPGRLDTFFLLDTSNSTKPYIDALSDGLFDLADALGENNVDGWFGLGEYQDYSGHGVRYRRRADIRPADAFLKGKLDSIRTSGGYEPGYTAIDQAVTGKGLLHPNEGRSVGVGQDAHWRHATRRLLFHVADEPFAHDPSGPGRERTAGDLNQHDVGFMGIAIAPGSSGSVPNLVAAACPASDALDAPDADLPETGDPNWVRLRCQMEDLARQTNTLAPPGGVDCDGDKVIDLAPGAPLVCVIPKGSGSKVAGLADAVKRLLLAVHFTQPVAFSAASQQPLQIDVTPGADYSHVDLRLDNQLSFRAVFSCAQEAQGHDYTVDLQASVDTLAFAHARPQVFCDGVPAAVVPPPHKKAAPAPPHRPALAKAVAAAAQPQTVIALAPIPPPPPARAPVHQSAQAQAPAQAPQPGQATSQVVQSQGQTSPVQMAADQRQESPVVQKVHLDGDAAPGEGDLHFARADSIDGVDHDAWWAAMLVRTLGFGAVLGLGAAAVRRRERAPQAKRARNRR